MPGKVKNTDRVLFSLHLGVVSSHSGLGNAQFPLSHINVAEDLKDLGPNINNGGPHERGASRMNQVLFNSNYFKIFK